jgi:hypothetical protein
MRRVVLIPVLLPLALAACAGGGSQPSANAQAEAACRQRADAVYNQQNRAAIYSPQSQVNTPYSGNYTPDVTTRGLSDLFVHETMVRDCVRNTGTETDRGAGGPRP